MNHTKPVITSTFDPQLIAPITQKLRTIIDELIRIFPERSQLLNQILYALLTREHVLVFGTFGTGKSDLTTTLFASITGAEHFSIGLSKFMGEGNIVGIPNTRIMREEGRIEYNTERTMITCHFAEIDEILDGNAPLLRVLLGILNERHFKRGRQNEKARLLTAIGSTNGTPADEMKREPSLGAVIDRFIFHSSVGYLKEPESRRRMYEKYLSGERPTNTISLEELLQLSDIVVGANQITDPHFVEVYDDVIQAYRTSMAAQKVVISDRRACKLLKIVEAEAVLQGRYEPLFEDLMSIRWGLCLGGDTTQTETFTRLATPIIDKAIGDRKQSLDEVQLRLLGEYASNIPEVPATCPDADLVNLMRQLRKVREQIHEVKPNLQSTTDKQREMLREVDRRIADVQKRIDG